MPNVTFEAFTMITPDVMEIKVSDSCANIAKYGTLEDGDVCLFFTNSTSSSFDPDDQIAIEAKSVYHSENLYSYIGTSISPYYDNQNYDRAAVHILLGFFKQKITELDHNYLCNKYKNGFSAWLFLRCDPSGLSTTPFSYGVAAHCYGNSATDVLGFLRRLYGCDYTFDGESYTLNPIINPGAYTSAATGPYSDQEGFFLGAGYIEDVASTITVNSTQCVFNKQHFITDGSYIGLTVLDSGFCTVSSPLASLTDIADYEQQYQLIQRSSTSYYYISVTASGSGSGSGSSGSDNVDSYSPLDITVTTSSNTQNYITDFSQWKLHFIPADDFDGEFNIQGNVLNISSNTLGGQVLYPDITEPKIQLNSYEIDQNELFELLDAAMDNLSIKITISDGENTLTMSEYFSLDVVSRANYSFIYTNSTGEILDINLLTYLDSVQYQLINMGYNLSVDLGLKQNKNAINLYGLEILEAYTRGHDFIQENYTSVRPEERDPDDSSETSRLMSYDDNYFVYKYSGRDIDIFAGASRDQAYSLYDAYYALAHSCDILQEEDVTLGDTYEQQDYFIEAAEVCDDNGLQIYKDTFKIIDYLDPETGLFDPTQYTDEDVEVHTAHIDLTQCEYYRPLEGTFENGWCDCAAKTNGEKATVECAYQKMGYCPYRFQTEKHPRRIRTLQEAQSNRFNLIQELCETFEFYPYFYTEHNRNGRCVLDDNGEMKKHVFFATEKGSEKYAGFRYEKNLKSMQRDLDSSSITTKLYVENIDSDYSSTGMCSIQTATDNISRTSYILDFSYYTQMGMLDSEQVQRDLYGIDADDFAFLPRIGEYNKQYDQYSELIITMTGETLVDLEAQIDVATTGISSALEERQNVSQSMYQYKVTVTQLIDELETNYTYTVSDTYKNYAEKYRQLAVILWGNVETLFFSGDYFAFPASDGTFTVLNYNTPTPINGLTAEEYEKYTQQYCKGEFFWRLVIEGFGDDSLYSPPFNSWEEFKSDVIDDKLYETTGIMGRYKSLYNEVKYWKKERAKILNKINDLSEQFHRRYEPYIKEGTFSDDNYLDDNEYYWAGVSVLKDSCEPQISYTFTTIDLSPLKIFQDDYTFALGDVTYVEDIDFFGVNSHTGLPNREKIIISSISYDLDSPQNNSITAQNYNSQFEDLFEQITATVQSLTLNENVYKRASNFTAQQYVDSDSLQGTLDVGDLTLLDTSVTLDGDGLKGDDANNQASQYDVRNDGIYFSTDGGETWDYGVGAEGINMNYATIGQLDTSKVQVVDGDYIYFLWDKDGINAYRNPSTSTDGLVDFARFNRYGLSLIENNNVRLRAGYEFLSAQNTGNYLTEEELTTQNIGFYLYNNNGQAIFKTETDSAYSGKSDYSARLSLTGEIFVTNQILSGKQDVSTTTNYTLSGQYTFVTNYKYEYTFDENDRSFEELIWDVYNSYAGYFIYTIDANGATVRIGTEITMKGESPSYYYDETFYAIHVDAKNDNCAVITTYTINYIASTSAVVDVVSLFEGASDNTIYGSMSTLEYQIYIGGNSSLRGARTVRLSYYTLDDYQENSQVNVTNYTTTTVEYEDDSGNSHTLQLYATTQDGVTSYWGNMTADGAGYVEDNAYANNGVGIYINNTQSVHNNDSDYEDKTLVYDGDNYQEIILSGAERQFLIASQSQSANHVEYHNIISILKNGVLYMGGDIINSDNTSLNISGLSGMPDDIKIHNPRFVLGTNGYVYCQWDKFFNLIVSEDGTTNFGNVSLADCISHIQDYLQSSDNSGSTSSTTTLGAPYFDEDQIDANI